MAAVLILAFATLAFGSQQGLAAASSLSVKGIIGESGNDKVALVFSMLREGAQALSFNLSGQIESLSAYDETGRKLDAEVKILNGSTWIRLTVPNRYARIDMATDYLTSKTGARWAYNSTYSIDSPLDNFDGEIVLPPGAVVRTTNGIQVNSGDSVAIVWHYTGIAARTPINRYVTYQISQADDYASLYIIGAALLASLVLIYAMLRLRSGKRQEIRIVRTYQAKRPDGNGKKRSFEDNPAFAAMEETDKEILRELHAQGGKTTQARIYQRIHISKSSLSRHLMSLERRGVVKRSKKGINTLVSIADALK